MDFLGWRVILSDRLHHPLNGGFLKTEFPKNDIHKKWANITENPIVVGFLHSYIGWCVCTYLKHNYTLSVFYIVV